jgi:hypothetical protein
MDLSQTPGTLDDDEVAVPCRRSWLQTRSVSGYANAGGFANSSFRHTSTVTQQVFEEYNEMIQDTAYNLEIQLQRIEEKVGSVNTTLQGGQPAVLVEQPRERLDSSNFDRGPDRETLWFVKEAEIANQGLELCTQVSKQLPTQTIHIIDEAICEGNSSQVVVTTLADLFVVGKVKAKKNSSQLVGSMDSNTLLALVKQHYGSG